MRFCLAALFALLLHPSFAPAADKTMRFGLMPIASRYEINDPLGSTKSGSDVTPLSGVVIFDAGRDSRVFVHAYSADFQVTASTTDIGQKVKQAGINASYQTMFRLTRSIKPWLGLGLGYASERYQQRYRVTSGGFLAPGSPYESRSIENYTAVLNASHEWQYNRNYDIGLHLQYEQPISSGGASAARLGFYVVY
jgi:outer membrane autotransporter protein